MSEHDSHPDDPRFCPGAAALAWLWPGLGHIRLGERQRGIYIMIGLVGLILGGLLIGGFDAVDRKSDRLWFFAQVLGGPIVIGADAITQHFVKIVPTEELGARLAQGDADALATVRRTGLGKVNEIGTLFVALAGLMNLIVILDVLYYRPPTPDRDPPEPIDAIDAIEQTA